MGLDAEFTPETLKRRQPILCGALVRVHLLESWDRKIWKY